MFQVSTRSTIRFSPRCDLCFFILSNIYSCSVILNQFMNILELLCVYTGEYPVRAEHDLFALVWRPRGWRLRTRLARLRGSHLGSHLGSVQPRDRG